MLSHHILKRGKGLPLFFFLLSATSLLAQQKDTTQQGAPQLQSLPQAPVPAPRPVPEPVPVPAPAPPPARPAEQPKAVPDTAQNEKEPYDLLKRLFVGGSASLGFQSIRYYGNYFNIGASPLLGYKLNKFLALGPGLIYQFYTMGGSRNHDYGAKIFGQATIYKSFLVHAEHSVVNTQDYDVDQATGRITDRFRTTLATTLLGGGYRTMANNRFGMDLYVLFPVRYSTYTYTQSYSPVIRAGFIYHLK